MGNGGSGKSWLAKNLASSSGSSVIHLDELFWEPGNFNTKRETFEVESLIVESLKEKSWIVEGVFGNLIEHYLLKAHRLIWLDIEWEICKTRLLNRAEENKEHHRRKQTEENLANLIVWASKYQSRIDSMSYVGHKDIYERFNGEKRICTSENDVSQFLTSSKNG